MNDLIQELADQCYYYDDDNRNVERFNKEKFAELIIKQCLAQADSVIDMFNDPREYSKAIGASYVGVAIERHFDIK